MVAFVLFMLNCLLYRFIKAFQDILGVNKSDDAVKIDGTTKAIINPEQGSDVSWIG